MPEEPVRFLSSPFSYAIKTDTGGGAVDSAIIKLQGHQRQFEDFIMAIETGRNQPVDGPEARKAVEIILVIYQSAREGKRITLPFTP